MAEKVESFVHREAVIEEHRLFRGRERGGEHGCVALQTQFIDGIGKANS
jgi:neutral trehalase